VLHFAGLKALDRQCAHDQFLLAEAPLEALAPVPPRTGIPVAHSLIAKAKTRKSR